MRAGRGLRAGDHPKLGFPVISTRARAGEGNNPRLSVFDVATDREAAAGCRARCRPPRSWWRFLQVIEQRNPGEDLDDERGGEREPASEAVYRGQEPG